MRISAMDLPPKYCAQVVEQILAKEQEKKEVEQDAGAGQAVKAIFQHDLKRQTIDHETVDRVWNDLYAVWMRKSTSGKLGAVLWRAMMVIARQRLEITKLENQLNCQNDQ